MKLQFMLNAGGPTSALSAVQKRQLATAASTWLWHQVAGRTMDRSDLASMLEAIAKGEGDRDADLLAAVAEFHAVEALYADEGADEKALDQRHLKAQDTIVETPASTVAGLLAKLDLVRRDVTGAGEDASGLRDSAIDDVERFLGAL
jgi:hypothetical protein